MDVLRLLAYGGMGIGCLLMIFGLLGRRNWQAKLDRERVRATGTVSRHAHKANGGHGRSPCHPVIRFRAEGVERESEWNCSVPREDWPVGREVELLYDPDHPENIHLADEEGERPPNGVMRTGVVWIAAGLAIVLALNWVGGSGLQLVRGRRGARLTVASTKKDETEKDLGGYSVRLNQGGTATLTGYSGGESSVVVPMFAEGSLVTAIERGTFSSNRALREITVHGLVRDIPLCAFAGCVDLSDVTLLEGVATIGRAAFNPCMNLRNVTLPASITRIEDDAFPDDCEAMFHVVAGSYAEEWCREKGYETEAE